MPIKPYKSVTVDGFVFLTWSNYQHRFEPTISVWQWKINLVLFHSQWSEWRWTLRAQSRWRLSYRAFKITIKDMNTNRLRTISDWMKEAPSQSWPFCPCDILGVRTHDVRTCGRPNNGLTTVTKHPVICIF